MRCGEGHESGILAIRSSGTRGKILITFWRGRSTFPKWPGTRVDRLMVAVPWLPIRTRTR